MFHKLILTLVFNSHGKIIWAKEAVLQESAILKVNTMQSNDRFLRARFALSGKTSLDFHNTLGMILKISLSGVAEQV